MNQLKLYFKRNRYYVLFISVLLVIGIVIGLYLSISNFSNLNEDVLYYIENINNKTYNYIFIHFFLVVISVITSFFGIGVPLLCTILFYEGLSLGFLIGIFSLTNGLLGLIFSLIFILVTKLFYVIALIFLFSKCLSIARKMIGKFIYKTDPSIMVKHLFLGCLCVISFLLIYDTLLFFFGSKIISVFSFLLS